MMDFLLALMKRPDGRPRAAFWAPVLLLGLFVIALMWPTSHIP